MNDLQLKRLSVLKRQNLRNRILPKYINRLSEVEPKLMEANILDIEEIDEMRKKQKSHGVRTRNFSKQTSQSNPEIMREILQRLHKQLAEQNYFSINSLYELWYAKVNTTFVIEHFEHIIDIDGDSLIIVDQKLNNGLWIDLSEESKAIEMLESSHWIYEISVWGKEWTSELF